MAGPFAAMDVASTGVAFSQRWIDALAHNIANANTVRPADQEPFEAVVLVARSRDDAALGATGSGVEVADVRRAGGEPTRAFRPDDPNADADGWVVLPDVDLAAQMSDLMIAQRSFQASVRAIRSAEEVYRSALQIGQRR